MKIKLVCSDIDGTLLQNGCRTLSREIFEQIRALTAHGILFCPASGRQYASLRQSFAAVADDCAFLCENGAVVYKGARRLANTAMPRALAEVIANTMWQDCDGCGEVLISGADRCYMLERGSGLGMAEHIRAIGCNYAVIHDPAEVPEEIVKVSLYVPTGIAPYQDRFLTRWPQVNCAVAGRRWLDTMQADKGTGLLALCNALSIDPAEVMAFGDNYNDVPLLDLVGTPYIMQSAAEPLRRRYPNTTARPEDTLREFLAGLM